MPKGYMSALLVLMIVNWAIGYGIISMLVSILRHIKWVVA